MPHQGILTRQDASRMNQAWQHRHPQENSLNQHGPGNTFEILRLALSRIRSLGLAQESQVKLHR